MRNPTRSRSRFLLHRFVAAIAIAGPAAAACGGTSLDGSTPSDAGPDNYRNCGGEQIRTTSYKTCSPVDASADGASDAMGDSGLSDGGDASPDATAVPPCYFFCKDACEAINGGVQTLGFMSSCTDTLDDGGGRTAECHFVHPCGRRPAGLERTKPKDGSPHAQHLALSAWMEAASVTAFERMARELEAHGAPRSLVVAAKRAARDEVRHTRTMTRLARRSGISPPKPRVRERSVRTLFAVARENIAEGCVRETYGALLALWQAEHAGDRELRNAMKTIAKDERRHAALAMTVAAWIEPRLTVAQRDRLNALRARTIAELRFDLSREVDASLVSEAGLPPARAALALHATLRDTVWTAA